MNKLSKYVAWNILFLLPITAIWAQDEEGLSRKELRELRRQKDTESQTENKEPVKEETADEKKAREEAEREAERRRQDEESKRRIQQKAKEKAEFDRLKEEAQALKEKDKRAQEEENRLAKEEKEKLKKEEKARKEEEDRIADEKKREEKKQKELAKQKDAEENHAKKEAERLAREEQIAKEELEKQNLENKKEIEKFFERQSQRNTKRKEFSDNYAVAIEKINKDYIEEMDNINKKLEVANEKKNDPETEKSALKAIGQLNEQKADVENQRTRKLDRLKTTESRKIEKLEIQLIKEENADLRRLSAKGIKDPRSNQDNKDSVTQRVHGDIVIKLTDIAQVDLESYPTFVEIVGQVSIAKSNPKSKAILSGRKEKIEFFDRISTSDDGYSIIHLLTGISVAIEANSEIVIFPSFQIDDFHVAHVLLNKGRINVIEKNANVKMKVLIETPKGKFLSTKEDTEIVATSYSDAETRITVLKGEAALIDDSHTILQKIDVNKMFVAYNEETSVNDLSEPTQNYVTRVFKHHNEVKQKSDEAGKENLDSQESNLLQVVSYSYPKNDLLIKKEAIEIANQNEKRKAFINSPEEYEDLREQLEKDKIKLVKKAEKQDKKEEKSAVKQIKKSEKQKSKELAKANAEDEKIIAKIEKDEKRDQKEEEKRKKELEKIEIKKEKIGNTDNQEMMNDNVVQEKSADIASALPDTLEVQVISTTYIGTPIEDEAKNIINQFQSKLNKILKSEKETSDKHLAAIQKLRSEKDKKYSGKDEAYNEKLNKSVEKFKMSEQKSLDKLKVEKDKLTLKAEKEVQALKLEQDKKKSSETVTNEKAVKKDEQVKPETPKETTEGGNDPNDELAKKKADYLLALKNKTEVQKQVIKDSYSRKYSEEEADASKGVQKFEAEIASLNMEIEAGKNTDKNQNKLASLQMKLQKEKDSSNESLVKSKAKLDSKMEKDLANVDKDAQKDEKKFLAKLAKEEKKLNKDADESKKVTPDAPAEAPTVSFIEPIKVNAIQTKEINVDLSTSDESIKNELSPAIEKSNKKLAKETESANKDILKVEEDISSLVSKKDSKYANKAEKYNKYLNKLNVSLQKTHDEAVKDLEKLKTKLEENISKDLKKLNEKAANEKAKADKEASKKSEKASEEIKPEEVTTQDTTIVEPKSLEVIGETVVQIDTSKADEAVLATINKSISEYNSKLSKEVSSANADLQSISKSMSDLEAHKDSKYSGKSEKYNKAMNKLNDKMVDTKAKHEHEIVKLKANSEEKLNSELQKLIEKSEKENRKADEKAKAEADEKAASAAKEEQIKANADKAAEENNTKEKVAEEPAKATEETTNLSEEIKSYINALDSKASLKAQIINEEYDGKLESAKTSAFKNVSKIEKKIKDLEEDKSSGKGDQTKIDEKIKDYNTKLEEENKKANENYEKEKAKIESKRAKDLEELRTDTQKEKDNFIKQEKELNKQLNK